MTIRAILTDIEGTTSSIRFVTDVLFPYARQHLPDYVRAHADQPDVAEQVQAVRDEIGLPDADLERVIETLLQWIAEDRKATPLKALQGLVWEQAYRSGEVKGHVYPDAVAALQQWHDAGLDLFVYSSGSIHAQKLIFGYSEAGDLTPLFSGYFDTTSGGKRDKESYCTIARALNLPAQQILFLSDVVEELDAAATAGMATWGLVRDGGRLGRHRLAQDFSQITP